MLEGKGQLGSDRDMEKPVSDAVKQKEKEKDLKKLDNLLNILFDNLVMEVEADKHMKDFMFGDWPEFPNKPRNRKGQGKAGEGAGRYGRRFVAGDYMLERVDKDHFAKKQDTPKPDKPNDEKKEEPKTNNDWYYQGSLILNKDGSIINSRGPSVESSEVKFSKSPEEKKTVEKTVKNATDSELLKELSNRTVKREAKERNTVICKDIDQLIEMINSFGFKKTGDK